MRDDRRGSQSALRAEEGGEERRRIGCNRSACRPCCRPEEVKKVETAIGAAKAEAARDTMLEKQRAHRWPASPMPGKGSPA
jgi:hypothetical protein